MPAVSSARSRSRGSRAKVARRPATPWTSAATTRLTDRTGPRTTRSPSRSIPRIRTTSWPGRTTTTTASTTRPVRGRRSFPTGFFTSFDGGATWIDGQIPIGSGNGDGDPAPAFDAEHDVALMAQLENVGGQGGPLGRSRRRLGEPIARRRRDVERPVTVFQGSGRRHRPGEQRRLLRQGVPGGRQQPGLSLLRPDLRHGVPVPERAAGQLRRVADLAELLRRRRRDVDAARRRSPDRTRAAPSSPPVPRASATRTSSRSRTSPPTARSTSTS